MLADIAVFHDTDGIGLCVGDIHSFLTRSQGRSISDQKTPVFAMRNVTYDHETYDCSTSCTKDLGSNKGKILRVMYVSNLFASLVCSNWYGILLKSAAAIVSFAVKGDISCRNHW